MLSFEPGHQLMATSTKILSAAPNWDVERRASKPTSAAPDPDARRRSRQPEEPLEPRPDHCTSLLRLGGRAPRRSASPTMTPSAAPRSRPRHSSTSLSSAAPNRNVECHSEEPAEPCLHQPEETRRPSAATVGRVSNDAERCAKERAEPCLHQPHERSTQQDVERHAEETAEPCLHQALEPAEPAERCLHQPLETSSPSAATIGRASNDAERHSEEPTEPCLHKPHKRSAQQGRRAPLRGAGRAMPPPAT